MLLRTLLLASFILSAQLPEDPYVYTHLRDYLQLTQEQYAKIQSNNKEYGDWLLDKLKRMKTVQDEIAVESKREVIVPGALGARYAEIEVIGRQLLERRKTLAADNRKVLTDAQLAKFKAFDEVFKLQPVIGAALHVNLLENEDTCFNYTSPTSRASIYFCSGESPLVVLP
jgi:hypothetical protein